MFICAAGFGGLDLTRHVCASFNVYHLFMGLLLIKHACFNPTVSIDIDGSALNSSSTSPPERIVELCQP